MTLSTTDFYTLPPSKHRLLRDLTNEYRDTQEALNHAQASLTRAIRLAEQNYQRKRRAILANGHDELDELRT
jgi:hypothetical protein